MLQRSRGRGGAASDATPVIVARHAMDCAPRKSSTSAGRYPVAGHPVARDSDVMRIRFELTFPRQPARGLHVFTCS
jgi:hypothetical protein